MKLQGLQLRPQKPRPLALIAGITLIALGIAMPAANTARELAWEVGLGTAAEPVPRTSVLDAEALLAGVWIWKLASVVLGLVWLAAESFRARGARAEPLLDGVRSAEEPPGPRWRSAAILVCAVGLALRFVDLGAGLWFDEIDTFVRFARGPLARAAATFETQNNHLAYSVLSNLSFDVFGPSAWALRLPAALLGAASLWALWRLALTVSPPAEALLATAALAFSSHHVWFSQDARGYTGLLLATLLSTHAFLGMLREQRADGVRAPLAYAGAASLGTWMHPTAAFVVVAHFAIWLWLCKRKPSARENRWPPLWGFVLATALSFWGYALVLPQLLGTLSGPSMPGQETEWRNPLWMVRETAIGLAAGIPGGWLALAEAVVVLALGAWSFARQSPAVLAAFALPAVLTGAAALLAGHNLWPRFFFFSAGFAALLVLRGIFEFVALFARGPVRPWRERLGWAAGALLCAASAAALPRAYGPKQDFSAALAFVREHAAPETVATLEMADLPFLDYLKQPWTAVRSLEELIAFEGEHAKTWVVYTMPTHLAAVQPGIWSRLAQEYEEMGVFTGTQRGGEIVVKVRGEN